MDTLKAIAERRSIRSYLPTAVEDSKIETLIGAANSAPFSGSFHISVLLNKELLVELNHKTLTAMKNSGNEFLQSRAGLPGYNPMYGAPLMLIFSAPAESPYGVPTCSNAATTAALAATELGLGSCYIITPTLVLAHDADLAKKSGIPGGFKAACCLLAGYVDDPKKYSAPKQKSENVTYIR